MKLAITADPILPVPPINYGGIERIIYNLICGLIERGHDVTLFAHPDSNVPCRLVGYPRTCYRSLHGQFQIAATIAREIFWGGYDIVHSFGRLAYLTPVLPLALPKLMTYQRAITARTVRLAFYLSRGSLSFSAVSRRMFSERNLRGRWNLIYNGVSEEGYELRTTVPADAPLVFLGRIERIKGTHIAIEVARQSDRRLVIAGIVSPGLEHRRYFEEEIIPHIDNEQVRYVGPVNDEQKNALLGQSAALLMPVQWEEPFGIVMAEALACGTPIVGFDRGSIPEVVTHGKNGFVCTSVDDMVKAVKQLSVLSRRNCRRTMEERFSTHTMVQSYESLYVDLTAGEAVSREKLYPR